MRHVTLLVIGLVSLLPATASAQEVYKNIGSARLEKILADLNIDFKKTNGNKEGIHHYDFTRNGFKIRLINYEGKDLWIDTSSSDRLSPEDVNRWNVQAKFSRCVLVVNNDRTTLSLENQFDCLGGCTDAIVRQFIVRFDGELNRFSEFLRDNRQPR